MRFSSGLLAFIIAVLLLLVPMMVASSCSQEPTTSGDEATRRSSSVVRRKLQPNVPGLDQVFFAMIRGLCWLSTLFRSGRRYSNMLDRSEYNFMRVSGEEALEILRPNDVGPLALQGAFWLRIGPWVEALSYAPTNEGGGLSLGGLSDDPGNPAYRVRFLGDRVSWWAKLGKAPTLETNVLTLRFLAIKKTWGASNVPEFLGALTDPVGSFFLEEGTVENPTKLRIQIDFVFPLTCTRMTSEGCFSPILDWTMTLQNTPVNIADGRDPHPEFPDAVVWYRESAGIFNQNYEAIQVRNSAGEPIPLAAEAFIEDVNKFDGILLAMLNPDASEIQFCTRGLWWCFWC